MFALWSSLNYISTKHKGILKNSSQFRPIYMKTLTLAKGGLRLRRIWVHNTPYWGWVHTRDVDWRNSKNQAILLVVRGFFFIEYEELVLGFRYQSEKEWSGANIVIHKEKHMKPWVCSQTFELVMRTNTKSFKLSWCLKHHTHKVVLAY